MVGAATAVSGFAGGGGSPKPASLAMSRSCASLCSTSSSGTAVPSLRSWSWSGSKASLPRTVSAPMARHTHSIIGPASRSFHRRSKAHTSYSLIPTPSLKGTSIILAHFPYRSIADWQPAGLGDQTPLVLDEGLRACCPGVYLPWQDLPVSRLTDSTGVRGRCHCD